MSRSTLYLHAVRNAGQHLAWDRFGRIKQWVWLGSTSTTDEIDYYNYTYDYGGNRTSRDVRVGMIVDTCQVYMELAGDLRNCSRRKCKADMARIIKRMKRTCSLIPEPTAKKSCKASLELIRHTMAEVCNACRNP